MRFTSTGVAAAAMAALGITAYGTGIVGVAPHAASKPATFQMYANVDQLGDLGSNAGATSVTTSGNEANRLYAVTFNRPIGNCAAQAQSGYAGGDLEAGWYSAKVVDGGPKTFDVTFVDSVSNTGTRSAFMLTVTCHS